MNLQQTADARREVPVTDPYPSFGAWLHSTRIGLGLDLRALAQLSGVDRSTISRIERGVAEANVCTGIRLCTALEVDPKELVLALSGRQLFIAQPSRAVDTPFLTQRDLDRFIALCRKYPDSTGEWLASWLNRLAALVASLRGRPETAAHFTGDQVELLFQRQEPFFRFELVYPSDIDGLRILNLYRSGGLVTLRDVAAYVRWLRQEKGKSLKELARSGVGSSAALSRFETGGVGQMGIRELLTLDEVLDARGDLIGMCWTACAPVPPEGEASDVEHEPGPRTAWTADDERLAAWLLTVFRWKWVLDPTDDSWISALRQTLSDESGGPVSRREHL